MSTPRPNEFLYEDRRGNLVDENNNEVYNRELDPQNGPTLPRTINSTLGKYFSTVGEYISL